MPTHLVFLAEICHIQTIHGFIDRQKLLTQTVYQKDTAKFIIACLSFSNSLLSVVHLAVCHSVNFSHFSRTHGLVSTKLDTKHPLLHQITFIAIEGLNPFPKEDNSNTVKFVLTTVRIFSRTTILTRFATKYPWVKSSKVIQTKYHTLFQGEIMMTVKRH